MSLLNTATATTTATANGANGTESTMNTATANGTESTMNTATATRSKRADGKKTGNVGATAPSIESKQVSSALAAIKAAGGSRTEYVNAFKKAIIATAKCPSDNRPIKAMVKLANSRQTSDMKALRAYLVHTVKAVSWKGAPLKSPIELTSGKGLSEALILSDTWLAVDWHTVPESIQGPITTVYTLDDHLAGQSGTALAKARKSLVKAAKKFHDCLVDDERNTDDATIDTIASNFAITANELRDALCPPTK